MRVDVTDENRSKCICSECPTYMDCQEAANESLYCGTGASSCEVEQLGCICPKCPVHTSYSLASTYYCVEGAAE